MDKVEKIKAIIHESFVESSNKYKESGDEGT